MSTIKIEAEDGVLKFNFSDIFDAMTDEQKKELMKWAVWQRDIFEDLIHAIVHDHVVTEHFGSNIYDTRKQILDNLGVLEKNHFRSLIHELEQASLERDKWQRDYWKIYHSLLQEEKMRAPRREGYQHATWPSDADVENEIIKRATEQTPS